MKVRNLESPRTGRPVPNQFTITHNGKTYFQSYESLIAEYDGERLTLGCDFDYSVTTAKYLNVWMRENCLRIWYDLPDGKSFSDRLRKAIKAGQINYNSDMV